MAPSRYPYVHVSVGADDVELVSLELFELGANGVEERDATTLNRSDGSDVTLVASFESDADAEQARDALAGRFAARVEHVEGDAWRDAYKAYFKPARVGERLVVRPPWEPWDAAPSDVVLVLDPGRAFGTGTHESTRLVLSLVQRFVTPGCAVLDVGCGSGILSIACLLLGAGRARALDVDPEAVSATLENAVANGVAERLEVDGTPVEQVTERFPLVLANIESRVLLPMKDALFRRLSPSGVLILSGLLATERDTMVAAYGALELLAEDTQGEWLGLALRAPAAQERG
jgi:ribosomal protein L11 methyltransferase